MGTIDLKPGTGLEMERGRFASNGKKARKSVSIGSGLHSLSFGTVALNQKPPRGASGSFGRSWGGRAVSRGVLRSQNLRLGDDREIPVSSGRSREPGFGALQL